MSKQFWAHQAGVEIIAKVVSIARHQPLQVHNVVAAVGALDALHFNGACDLDTLPIRLVYDPVNL